MRNRILTYFVVIATCIALSVTLWTSYETRKVSECQTEVNQKFLATIKSRAGFSEIDRQSMRTLVKGVINAKSNEDLQKALDDYIETQKTQDDLRAEFEYPDLTNC